MSQGLHARKKARLPLRNVVLGSLLVAAAVVAGVSGVATPRASASGGTAPVAPPPCPAGDSCVSIPCSTGVCPTVQAGPTTGIQENPAPEYVFVNLYGYPSGDAPGVWLCSDTEPLTTAAPLCSIAAPAAEVYAPVFANGTSQVSFQVPEVENDGESPLSGEELGDPSVRGTFFCDNSSDPCSIDVFDPNLGGTQTATTANTLVMPVTFAASGSGCPKATLVNTESDFGIEGLIDDANQSGCLGSDPVIAFNTALDSLSAVTDLAAGEDHIAFTDDPNAPDEQAVLGGTSGHYALIPVAASADVMGFAATISPNSIENRTLYPHTTFDLTPNMVAGLVNSSYDTVTSADTMTGVSCTNPGIAPPSKLDPCPAMEFINRVVGFLPEEDYQAYVRSDNAGVTDELFQWLCAAPDHTVTIAGKPESEADTSAQILDATSWTDTSLDGKCPDTDQFPALAEPAFLNSDKNPQNQAKALYTQVNVNAEPPREAGFADMNWYEASYYGLDAASLQNAAGVFVAPSAASIDAALGDATAEPNGTLNFDYTNTSDTAAYPEPVIFYAAVSTEPQPAAQADAIKTIIGNMLSLTASPGASGLPPGIVPLTSSLTTEAEADLSKDIVAIASKPGGGGTTGNKGSGGGGGTKSHPGGSSTQTGGGSTGSTTTTTVTQPSGSITTTTSTGTGAKAVTTGASNSSHPATTGNHKSPPPPSTPSAVFRAVQVALAAPEWRWLLTVMFLIGAIALCTGPLVLFAQRLRTKLASVRRGRT
jgi:hypothetical protein